MERAGKHNSAPGFSWGGSSSQPFGGGDPRMAPVYVLLDDIRSAYNVGSIFRTSDAARVRHLFLCGMTAYPPHEKLNKTALGALDHVSWSHHVEPEPVVVSFKEAGGQVWACEPGLGASDYTKTPCPCPVLLLFGHEVGGIRPGLLARADRRVAIPMGGHKESLNVATAYGVIVFEILRQFEDRGVWKR